MAEDLGAELPDEIYGDLEVEKRDRSGTVISLLTSDRSGYPRVCLLSPYQVVASDRKSLYLAVYTETKTSKNLRRSGKASLVVVSPPSIYYVNGPVKALTTKLSKENLLFFLRVREVKRDYSSKAPITSRLAFDETNVKSYYGQVFASISGIIRTKRVSKVR